MVRPGNNPKRRVVPIDEIDKGIVEQLLTSVEYVGSGHHKQHPSDYGFGRTNPRPTKSLCDIHKPIKLGDAKSLLETGIKKGMVSDLSGGLPKYIWCVDADEIVYEAKTDRNANGSYHGYPLENENVVRDYILSEWKTRCR